MGLDPWSGGGGVLALSSELKQLLSNDGLFYLKDFSLQNISLDVRDKLVLVEMLDLSNSLKGGLKLLY